MNSSTADREKVTKLKKVYAQLNEAFERAKAVYGPIDEWPYDPDNNNSEFFTSRLLEFMKYQKIINDGVGAELADGASFEIWQFMNVCGPSSSYQNLHHYGEGVVDIDGPNKGKNGYGYDVFKFDITENGILPPETQYYFDNKNECGSTNGIYCGEDGVYYATAWVIQNGNMDYLKTDENGKCNDSDIVLDWTTNTSCK